MKGDNLILLDINECAYLLRHGIEPVLEKRRDGRVIFVYEPSERLASLQNAYNQDDELQSFVRCLKWLRMRMLDRRDGRSLNGNNGNGERYAENLSYQ